MGLQIWKRSKENHAVDRKILFAIEKMTRDAASAVRTETESLKGKGDESRFELPAIVKASSKEETLQYGHVLYQWDSSRKELCRAEKTATDDYRDKDPVCRPIAGWIKNLRFQYLVYEGIGGKYDWTNEWDEKDDLPIAIKVRIDIDPGAYGKRKGKGADPEPYQRTLRLPVGGATAKDKFSLGQITTVTLTTSTEGVANAPAT